MVTRLKQLLALVLFAAVAAGFNVAIAAGPIDVTVTVRDKSSKAMPFAAVSLNGKNYQTGPRGESIKLELADGRYSVSASHPLVQDKKGSLARASGKLKLTSKKPAVALTMSLKGTMTADSTPPVINPQNTEFKREVGQANPIMLQAQITDPDSRVAMVNATIDGKDIDQPQANNDIYTWTLDELGLGTHQVVYTAWNYAGASTSVTINFKISAATGSLTGKVNKGIAPNLTPVANATVSLGAALTRQTDSDGTFNFTDLPLGNYTLTVSAPGFTAQTKPITIIEGQATTASVTLSPLPDTTAPAMPANVLVSNGTPSTSSQKVSWGEVTDISGVSYELRRYTEASLSETKQTTTITHDFSALIANTSYSYMVRAIDGAGNASAWTGTSSLTTQKTPTSSWSSPAANSTVKGTVALKADYEVFGNGNVATSISFALKDGATLAAANPNNAAGTSTYNWDTTTLAKGSKTLVVTLRDNQSNGSSAELTVNVDNSVVVVPSFIEGNVTYAGQPVANATIKSDEGTSATTNVSGIYRMGAAVGARQLSVAATGLSPQTKSVTVVQNQNSTLDFVMVDGIAPTIPTNLTASNASPSISKQVLNWTAATDFSGILSYEIQRLVGTTVAETKSTADTTFSFTGLNSGSLYSYKVRSQDKATPSNWSDWTSAVSARTLIAPTINWTAPSANAIVSEAVSLNATYSVGTAEPKSVTWKNITDNTQLGTVSPSAPTAQVSLNWDSKTVVNGAKLLRMTVTDTEDNIATADLNITVDNVAPITTGDLDGSVTDKANSTILAAMTVELRSANGATVIGTTTTDAAGKYAFKSLNTADYKLTISGEGYNDTVGTLTVKTGANTANVAMVSLPMLNIGSSVRTLPNPTGRTFDFPGGMSISPDGKELAILERGTNDIDFYNVSTENFVSSFVTNLVFADYLAHDSAGLMIARYGDSHWYTRSDKLESAGKGLSYRQIYPQNDGSVLALDNNKIWRFVNRQPVPTTGISTVGITGYQNGLAYSAKNYFIVNVRDSKLFRLDLDDPTNTSKVQSINLNFAPLKPYIVPGTRTLLIAEKNSRKIHSFDIRTMQEYQVSDLPTVGLFTFDETGQGLTGYYDPSTISAKLFLTLGEIRKDNSVYVINATKQ